MCAHGAGLQKMLPMPNPWHYDFPGSFLEIQKPAGLVYLNLHHQPTCTFIHIQAHMCTPPCQAGKWFLLLSYSLYVCQMAEKPPNCGVMAVGNAWSCPAYMAVKPSPARWGATAKPQHAPV